MAISEEQKEEIRSKVDIADLVSSYGFQLKQSGSDLWCCCPFHNEKTPSFKVDSSRGTYHCFGCGESGDVFSFVMKQEGLSFGEAIQKLASSVGIELKATTSPTSRLRKRLYELMAALAIDFNKMLKSKKNLDGEIARQYLEKRQLDIETVDKFLIGYAPKDVDKILSWANKRGYSYQDLVAAGIIKASDSADKKPYFYFANRLVLTLKDKNGHVVAFSGRQLVEDKKSGKYVNSPETLIFKKSRNFFAYDEARKYIVKAPNREAIVCEGQIDCIRLHANGYNTAVAPLGTAFTEDHAVMLHRVADTALLCFDDDGAGHKATIKAAQLLLAEGMPIRVVSLPDGDDPDSFILKHGKEAFGKLIMEKAESIVKFQIRAEKAKETNPNDPNAAVRVTKAVLETISKCTDKVLRNVLLKDAAKSLGIDFETLSSDIAGIVKTTEKEQSATDEQLIEPCIASKPEAENNPPSLAVGSLINFLMANEGNNEIKEYISQLIPPCVIGSPMARSIIEAWVDGKTVDGDRIREVVEALPIEDYRQLLLIMASMDSTEYSEITLKNMVVYFARQIWHEYLVRLLTDFRGVGDKEKILADSLKTLHSATMKGVVHLIANFPHERFICGKTPQDVVPIGKDKPQ